MVFGKVKLVTQVNRRRTQSVAAKVLASHNAAPAASSSHLKVLRVGFTSAFPMMAAGDQEATGCDFEGLLSDAQVVFQCESCRSILGDATNWIAATQPLEAFTLSAVTECVSVGETLHHSTQTHDAGSSYCLLSCRTCHVELGRRYVTTPSHLDHLRDNFTLYVAMVTSYQLGSAGVKAMSKGQEPPLLLKLAEKCMKLQHLLVTMNERVCDIEQCLRDDGDGDQAK